MTATGRPVVEQVWFTYFTDLNVRAASPGLQDPVEQRKLRDHCLVYRLPKAVDPNTAPPSSCPINLSLVDVGEYRALLRTRWLGKDPSGRSGNRFVHAVAGPTGVFTAHWALSLWNSQFWCEDDHDKSSYDTKLSRLGLDEISPPVFGHETLLNDAEVSRHLPWLIRAFLSLQPHQRLYVAAEPDLVVRLLSALTCALPAGLTKTMTFSTYASTADLFHTFQPRVVGTCFNLLGHGQLGDLPPECYGDKGLAINCFPGKYFGKASQLPAWGELETYAAFAANCVSDANKRDRLKRILDYTTNVTAVDELLQYFRLNVYRPEALTDEEVRRLLLDPRLAAERLRGQEDRAQLLERIARRPDWWYGAIRSTLAGLKAGTQGPSAAQIDEELTQLALDAVNLAAVAVCSGNISGASFFFDEVARHVAPDGIDLAKELLRSMADRAGPSDVSPAAKEWLFRRWRSLPVDLVTPWLIVSWSALPPLLHDHSATDMPMEWRLAALEAGIAANSLPATRRDVEIEVWQLRTALRNLVEGGALEQVYNFYGRLVRLDRQKALSLLPTLLRAAPTDAGIFCSKIINESRLRGAELEAMDKVFLELLFGAADGETRTRLAGEYLVHVEGGIKDPGDADSPLSTTWNLSGRIRDWPLDTLLAVPVGLRGGRVGELPMLDPQRRRFAMRPLDVFVSSDLPYLNKNQHLRLRSWARIGQFLGTEELPADELATCLVALKTHRVALAPAVIARLATTLQEGAQLQDVLHHVAPSLGFSEEQVFRALVRRVDVFDFPMYARVAFERDGNALRRELEHDLRGNDKVWLAVDRDVAMWSDAAARRWATWSSHIMATPTQSKPVLPYVTWQDTVRICLAVVAILLCLALAIVIGHHLGGTFRLPFSPTPPRPTGRAPTVAGSLISQIVIG